MKKETLEQDIKQATVQLIDLARESHWNKISKNTSYILTEITKSEGQGMLEIAKARRKKNEQKEPVSLFQIVSQLEVLYPYLYDVNLQIYEAEPNETVVEIGYYLKTSLVDEYLRIVKDNEPMLHCQILIPPSATEKEKFNVTWKFNL